MARLLYFSVTTPVGGHLRSALTIGKAMRDRGHEVWFVCPNGPGLGIVKQSGLNHFILPSRPLSSNNFNWMDFLALLGFARRVQPEIIHTFLGGILQLSIISRIVEAKLVATICGGPPRRFFTKMRPITVFSEELREWLLSQKHSEDAISVIPGRMDLEVPRPDAQVKGFFQHHDVEAPSGPVCLMVCRTDADKMDTIRFFFQAAKMHALDGRPGAFVHIGNGNGDGCEEEIRKEAESINRIAGRNVLISTDYGSDNPVKYMHLADVVVGMGRSAFEGMAMGKPTLILSEEGFGGLVTDTTARELSHCNFTARHVTHQEDLAVENFLRKYHKLVDETEFARHAGTFARRWYEENLDVRTAVLRYEDLYNAREPLYKPPGIYEKLKVGSWEMARTFFHAWKQGQRNPGKQGEVAP